MRYKIIMGQVRESIFIDAPYDTKQDAQFDLAQGIYHACEYCNFDGTCGLDQEEENSRVSKDIDWRRL